jgi:hypothetical protein
MVEAAVERTSHGMQLVADRSLRGRFADCGTEPPVWRSGQREDKVMTEQPRERELDILIGSGINRGETVAH